MGISIEVKNIQLSRVPKGYETDNPAAEYLKLKKLVSPLYPLAMLILLQKHLVKKTVDSV